MEMANKNEADCRVGTTDTFSLLVPLRPTRWRWRGDGDGGDGRHGALGPWALAPGATWASHQRQRSILVEVQVSATSSPTTLLPLVSNGAVLCVTSERLVLCR